MLEAIADFDAAALLLIQERLRCGIGNVLLPLWSNLGNAGLVWIAAAVLMLLLRRTRRAGTLALGGMGFNLLVVNVILFALTDIANLRARLPLPIAVVLVLISIVLTLFAGIIPSRSAAKKDPVVALRTE